MYLPEGQVDHYRCQKHHRHLTYEWSNYRLCSGSINSRKGSKDVLDPYTVCDEWFELHHPSLQLILTEAVPERERERASRTIIALGLRDGEKILKQRRQWLNLYQSDELSFEGLAKMAPLIAAMVKREGL